MPKAKMASSSGGTGTSPLAAASASAGAAPAFPVVAVGASAGGLEAFTQFLKALPAKSGMAFVLIQHLEPHSPSALPEILSRQTAMPVAEAADGLALEPDHVYVIPPNRNMTIAKGCLRLTPLPGDSQLRHSIDDFAVSLARDRGSAAIGVLLSGAGFDGTKGLIAIKDAGGVTFAQDPHSAEWPIMPNQAIEAGAADFVLTPERIAAELVRLGQNGAAQPEPNGPTKAQFSEICLIVRDLVGRDFRLYKPGTMQRRIARRMALRTIFSFEQYAQFLKENPDEARALANDVLIQVTSFFRDPESFEALRLQVLSKFRDRPAKEPIRIWVAGCSTGEEVYSLAMLLLEERGDSAQVAGIQIFGTDLHRRAIETARAGIYPEAAVAGVSAERLKRFFVKREGGYQIAKPVRELCIFAEHDLASDPPLSKLDLVVCRNVLMYMGRTLQNRVLGLFEYALNPGGFLFLGNGEALGDAADLFSVVDRKNRIFLRQPGTSAHWLSLAASPVPKSSHAQQPSGPPAGRREEAIKALVEEYAPPAVVVDPDLHIVSFEGNTSAYLSFAGGELKHDLFKMIRPELLVDLRTAIQQAKQEGRIVRKEAARIGGDGKPEALRLDVYPLGIERGFLIAFQAAGKTALPHSEGQDAENEIARLERELDDARQSLRSEITGRAVAQEEMKAVQEELLSANEELRSSIEELESSKETVQSTNEELLTVNSELQRRNVELGLLTADLGNLLEGIGIPVVVLDSALRVRRFTPSAARIFNLLSRDEGRPFRDLATNLDVPDWDNLLSQVTKGGQSVERQVSDRTGHRYSLTVRPYRNAAERIEGVLLVMVDTESIHRALDESRRSRDYAQAIVQTIHDALVVVDSEFRIVSVNRSFCELFRVSPRDVERRSFFGAGKGQFGDSRLRELVGEALSKHSLIQNFEVASSFPEIGSRSLILDAGQVDTSGTILIALRDVTEQKAAENEARRQGNMVRGLLEASTQSIIAVNEEQVIVMTNGRTEKMFGYSREELLDRPLDVLIPEESRGRHKQHHKVFFADMRSRPMGIGMELAGRRKDGSTFPVEIGLSPLESASGKIAVAFVSDITERKRLEQDAARHAAAVQALAANLMVAQEEERRRVSRDLHDHICQQLASLAIETGGLAAQRAPHEVVQERLKKLQAGIVQASEQARHLAYELHPSVLDDLGLIAALRALCKEFSAREGVRVECTSGALPGRLPREIASCLYRVAEASLQNVAQHAHAKSVIVAMRTANGRITLTIQDDGAGFDPEAVRGKGGLGLIGMEERARLVNGTFTLASRPGRGALITIEVPIPGNTV